MDLSDQVRDVLRRQDGLVTRSQLYEAGVTRAMIRWRLGRSWTSVHGVVISTSGSELTFRQRLVAAQLEAGPHAIITGEHACLYHGLDAVRGNRPVRVLVPMNQESRRVGYLSISRTRRPDPAPVVDGVLRVARIPRAVLDAARHARELDEARAVIIEAVQTRRASIESLQHELDAGPRRHSAYARRALADVRAGAWSVPEAHLLHLCSTSDVLPAPLPNPVLQHPEGSLISPDLWFDDVALAVMVHSRAHHARDADWESTVEADSTLTAHGVTVISFTPRSIATDPQRVLARIEQVYLSLRQSGRRRPQVTAIPRGWGLSA
ncbi:MAG TPA: hypothetical protein VFL94_08195 [Actinomycetales bacterium]|nr:hypothetical protein [Actinomycetales bacterium]